MSWFPTTFYSFQCRILSSLKHTKTLDTLFLSWQIIINFEFWYDQTTEMPRMWIHAKHCQTNTLCNHILYLICQDRKPKSCFVGNEINLKIWIVFQGCIINCDKGIWNPWILMQLIVFWSLTPSDLKNIERRSSRPDSIKVDVLVSIPSTNNAISELKLSSLSWVLWVARSLFCGSESLR